MPVQPLPTMATRFLGQVLFGRPIEKSEEVSPAEIKEESSLWSESCSPQT